MTIVSSANIDTVASAWKNHRLLARRLEQEALDASAAAQKVRYYQLAGHSFLRSAALAPYDRQHIVASDAARCYDAAASCTPTDQ